MPSIHVKYKYTVSRMRLQKFIPQFTLPTKYGCTILIQFRRVEVGDETTNIVMSRVLSHPVQSTHNPTA